MAQELKTIFDLQKVFPTEESCIEHLEKLRWNGNIISPFDTSSIVYKCSNNRYKCKNTGKYFNVKTGTIFEDTKIKLQKWFMALYIFSSHKKGISSHQLAKDIGVTQKTAWFMLHRLRYAFNHPNFKNILENTVEVDETFIGGDYKNKHADKKLEGTQGRSTKDKAVVLGMIERNGSLITEVIPDTKQITIQPIVEKNISFGSNVFTDEWHGYNKLSYNYNHKRVNHGAKEYVNMMIHTNNIENFWSHLKRGITGIYHCVSKEHLQKYVSEFTLRYNTRDNKVYQRFDLILCNVVGRLTYKQLINHE